MKLTNNMLKIIAVIAMIIDHVGYYFVDTLPVESYLICRMIGRIAMPIFVYLLVQGYFHTKSIRKYIIRLLSFAFITQLALGAVAYMNQVYFSAYVTNMFEIGNILFSFSLTMILICLLDRNVIHSKTCISRILDKVIRIFGIALIFVVYTNLKIDYGFSVPILAVTIYLVEKVREYMELEIKNYTYKLIICFAMLIVLLLTYPMVNSIQYFSVIAVIVIALYSGKLGKRSKLLRNSFYLFFPIHHVIIYFLAMYYFCK